MSIDHAELPQSQFDNSSFLYSNIAQTNLNHSSFAQTGLYHTSFSNVSLIGADLRGLYFDNATGATLDNVSCDNTTLLPNNLTCSAGVLAFNTNLIDDHSNSFDNATGIGLGQLVVGYLSPGDNDTFVFHMAADNKTTSYSIVKLPCIHISIMTMEPRFSTMTTKVLTIIQHPLRIKPNSFMTT